MKCKSHLGKLHKCQMIGTLSCALFNTDVSVNIFTVKKELISCSFNTFLIHFISVYICTDVTAWTEGNFSPSYSDLIVIKH